jgi:hypothetical protein
MLRRCPARRQQLHIRCWFQLVLQLQSTPGKSASEFMNAVLSLMKQINSMDRMRGLLSVGQRGSLVAAETLAQDILLRDSDPEQAVDSGGRASARPLARA